MVAHLPWEQGGAGSNLAAPTIENKGFPVFAGNPVSYLRYQLVLFSNSFEQTANAAFPTPTFLYFLTAIPFFMANTEKALFFYACLSSGEIIFLYSHYKLLGHFFETGADDLQPLQIQL